MVDNVSAPVMQLIRGEGVGLISIENHTKSLPHIERSSNECSNWDSSGFQSIVWAMAKQVIAILVTWHVEIYKVQQIIEQKFSIFATKLPRT